MRVLSYFLFFFTISVLVFTLYPTVSPYRDSGDMIVAAYTLGIAHQPGYPLYSVLGKIFSIIIPFANPGYRINLMSAIFTIFSIIILYWTFTINLSEKDKILKFLVSVICCVYCFIPSVWSLSQVSEMYTIAGFFLSLILLLMTKYISTYDKKYLYLLIFITSFSLSIHLTLGAVFVVLIIFLVYYSKDKNYEINFYDIKISILCFLLGISIFLFIPVRASTEPILNWGYVTDFNRFIRLVARADIGILKLHPEESKLSFTFDTLWVQTKFFFHTWYKEISLLGIIFSILGILFSHSQERLFTLLLFLLLGPGFFVMSNLDPGKNTTYSILQPQIVLVMVISIYWSIKGIISIFYKFLLVKFLLILLCILFLFLQLWKNFHFYNRREQYLGYDYGINLSRGLKVESIIYDPDDITTFILKYLQVCHNYRQDIKLITFFRTRWGYELLRKNYPEIIPGNIVSGIDFVDKFFYLNLPQGIYTDVVYKIPQNYYGIPYGVMYKVQNRELSLEELSEHISSIKFLFNESYIYREMYEPQVYPDFFSKKVINYYSSGLNNIAIMLNDTPDKHYVLFTGLTIDPELAELYNNLGVYYYNIKDYLRAIYFFKKSNELKPENINSKYNLSLALKSLATETGDEKYILEAKKLLKEIAEYSNYAPAYNDLAVIEMNSKNYPLAIEYLTKAIQLEPKYYNAYYNLVLCYKLTGEINKAKEIIKSYSGSKEEEKELHMLLQ